MDKIKIINTENHVIFRKRVNSTLFEDVSKGTAIMASAGAVVVLTRLGKMSIVQKIVAALATIKGALIATGITGLSVIWFSLRNAWFQSNFLDVKYSEIYGLEQSINKSFPNKLRDVQNVFKDIRGLSDFHLAKNFPERINSISDALVWLSKNDGTVIRLIAYLSDYDYKVIKKAFYSRTDNSMGYIPLPDLGVNAMGTDKVRIYCDVLCLTLAAAGQLDYLSSIGCSTPEGRGYQIFKKKGVFQIQHSAELSPSFQISQDSTKGSLFYKGYYVHKPVAYMILSLAALGLLPIIRDGERITPVRIESLNCSNPEHYNGSYVFVSEPATPIIVPMVPTLGGRSYYDGENSIIMDAMHGKVAGIEVEVVYE